MDIDDGAGDEVSLTVEFQAAAGTRSAEGWADWETQRTRSFFSPREDWLDSQRYLGRYRNTAVELVMKRTDQGFAGTWTFSIDTKIGPRRVERDGKIIFQVQSGGTTLFSTPATGLATVCGDWKTQTWSGSLTLEQFDAFTRVIASSNITARRC
jgi:hypothetical protein